MFILKAAYKQGLDPNPIFRGSKVLSMHLKKRNIKFLDSFLHIPMALSRMPIAYSFTDKAVKGYFPYLFARKENRGYVGQFPDIKYFDPGIYLYIY